MKLIWLMLIVSIVGVSDEEMIEPEQFRVNLIKNCEVLMIHKTRDKTSRKKHTSAAKGDCVENMGCVRDITQKELDDMDDNKRYIAEWENPIWCYVAVGKKKGWVERQFLTDEPCNELD